MLVGDADQSFRLPAHDDRLAGEQMKQTVVVQRLRHGQDVPQLARARQRFGGMHAGAVRIAHAEQRMGEKIGRQHEGVGGVTDRELRPLCGLVASERLLGVRARRDQVTDEELAVGERPMGDDPRHGIGLLLGETQQVTGHRQAQVEFRARYVMDPAPVQHRAQAALVADALAQLPRARERVAGLGRREAPGGDQRAAEAGLQAELGLVAMAALGKPGQDVESALQVDDRLMGGRAGDRELARLAPEFDGLLVEAGFSAVLGDQLRPVLQDLGEVRGEGARDPPVQLGAPLAQHGVVRGLLHQDVLEGVHRIRRLAAAEYQLRGAQLAQGALQLGLGQPGDRGEQLVGELAADHRGDLRHLLDRAEPIQAGGQ